MQRRFIHVKIHERLVISIKSAIIVLRSINVELNYINLNLSLESLKLLKIN